MLLDICMNLLLCHIFIMLRGEHDRLEALGFAVLIILYRHLCLSIGS